MGIAASKGCWLQLVLSGGASRGATSELWSKIDALGGVVLGDGVYVLPDHPHLEERVREVARFANSLGEQTWIFRSDAVDAAEALALQELFELDSLYAAWLEEVFHLQCRLEQLPLHEVHTQSRRLSLELKRLRSVDYFANETSRAAGRAWEQLDAQVKDAERASRLEPERGTGRITATCGATQRPIAASVQRG